MCLKSKHKGPLDKNKLTKNIMKLLALKARAPQWRDKRSACGSVATNYRHEMDNSTPVCKEKGLIAQEVLELKQV